jgi:S-adenosylmethionine hydrolase
VPSSRPFVSLTTDFGAAYSGICAGVVHSIVPDATVLVLSDQVTKYAIVEGALLLGQGLPYLPIGVHVGIVDPGVGTRRHPIALETRRGDLLVGPDNGMLTPAAGKLGGIVRSHRLDNPDYRLAEVSTTFHGRDIFAPAAGHLALGVDLARLGPSVEPRPLDLPTAGVGPGRLDAQVLYEDEFGSLILGAGREDLAAAFGPLEYGAALAVGEVRVTYQETFGAVALGEPLLWIDSSGALGLAVNQGSAARLFELGVGSIIHITYHLSRDS